MSLNAKESRKTRRVTIRLSPEDYDYIQDKALAIGKTVSETIRIMLNQWQIIMENPFFSVIRETDFDTILREPLIGYVKQYTELQKDPGKRRIMLSKKKENSDTNNALDSD